VNGFNKALIISLSLFLIVPLLFSSAALASTVYVSQSGGAFNGSGTACPGQTTISAAAFNGGVESAGNTYVLCGVITTELTGNGNGSSSSPITIQFDTNAKISLPACDNSNGCLNLSGMSWVVVDGGTACGPGTSCDTDESNNVSIDTGMIENTANGTNLANHVSGVGIMLNDPSCSNCEIKNLILRNFYVYVPNSGDPTNFGVTGGFFAGGVSGGAFLKIHDLKCHDVRACLSYNPVANDNGLQVYDVDFYNADGVNIENNSASTPLLGYAIHDSHIHDIANWDDSGCPYHHDGIHSWGLTGGTNAGEQFYNNQISGNFGACPTGAIFFEGSHTNAKIYNNVFLTTYTQENNGIFNVNGSGYQVFDNTIVGDNQSGDLCFNIGAASGTPSISFQNNIVTGCNTLILTQNNPSLTAWDYNVYGGCAPTGCNSSTPFVANGGTFDTFANWKTGCSCDSHSGYGASTSYAGLNSSGVPQSSSPTINWGANLTSMGMVPLDSETSDGDLITPALRSTGSCSTQGQASCWTIGAYNYGASAPVPNPPTGLSASVQ
jgi:hypothetical protein